MALRKTYGTTSRKDIIAIFGFLVLKNQKGGEE